MGVNDELDKGNKLLRDQTELVGVLDNAFKSIAANISNAIDTIIDELQGVDAVNQKIAKSYERDITNAIKKVSLGLEDNVALQLKINEGQNVSKELAAKRLNLETQQKVIQEKINQVFGENSDLAGKFNKQLQI